MTAMPSALFAGVIAYVLSNAAHSALVVRLEAFVVA